MDMRERLGRAVYGGRREISNAQWKFLFESTEIGWDIENFEEIEYSSDEDEKEAWSELRGLVGEKLRSMDEFAAAFEAERGGEAKTQTAPRASALGNQPGLTSEELRRLDVKRKDLETPLGRRNRARSETLRKLDESRAEKPLPYNRTPLSLAVLPRGGTDGSAAQWVVLMAVELWTPAEEIGAAYRSVQEDFSEETRPQKTEERAYEVARFVLDIRAYSPDYPWSSLLMHWNTSRRNDGDRFTGRAAEQTFRKYYSRGIKAALPRYEKSRASLEATIEKHTPQHLFDLWASGVRGTFE